MDKSSWTDGVRNEKVLQRFKEDKNAPQTIKTRKAHWFGHILRRNCFLKHVVEDKIEGRKKVTGRRGRGCKKLLDDLKEKAGYCKLKEEAMDRPMWKGCFGKDGGPVVRHTREYLVARNSSEK
jgi:hypothetical protein